MRVDPCRPADVPKLNALIAESARALSHGFYDDAQIEALITHVFGVDTQLVEDGTYFIVRSGDQTAGCGGWSRRHTLYGGDQRRVGAAGLLDPRVDAARIRAFFVAPDWARRGVATRLLDTCIAAARTEGFTRLELVATLPGVPFYARFGFAPGQTMRDTLPGGVEVIFVRMSRPIDPQVLGD